MASYQRPAAARAASRASAASAPGSPATAKNRANRPATAKGKSKDTASAASAPGSPATSKSKGKSKAKATASRPAKSKGKSKDTASRPATATAKISTVAGDPSRAAATAAPRRGLRRGMARAPEPDWWDSLGDEPDKDVDSDGLDFGMRVGLAVVGVCLLSILGITFSTMMHVKPATPPPPVTVTEEPLETTTETTVETTVETSVETTVETTTVEKTTTVTKTPSRSDSGGGNRQLSTSFSDGTVVAGRDVQAGTYRNSGGATCQWWFMRGEQVVDSGQTSQRFAVDIANDGVAFTSRGCGTWSKS